MDASNYMHELSAAGGGDAEGRRPVGRPRGPEKEKLPAVHVRDVPQAMKDALSALVAVGTIGFDDEGLSLRSTYGTQGDAVKTLILYGMMYVEPFMARHLAEERVAAMTYAEIVRAFIDDPTLQRVTEADFTEGTAAHAEMVAHRVDHEFSNGPDSWTRLGYERREAFADVATAQSRVEELARAHEAVRIVTGEYQERRKKAAQEWPAASTDPSA